MLKRALLLSVALWPALLPIWAQAQDKPALLTPGKLTYGVAATFAPFEYQKDGKLVGFDIEFIDAVAKKLGLSTKPLNIDFAGLIPALQGKRIDIINSGMYMNPKRAEQVDFVPYMKVGDEIVVRKGNPLGIQSRADLCGHKIAVTLGGIEETYARQDVEACQKAGKPEPTVLTLPTAQDSALALRQGRADALFNSSPGAAVMVTELPDVFQIAGHTFADGTQIGIAVRKGDTATAAALDKAIHAVVADGDYAKLLAKYNLPASGSIF
jgi:polar amino acid transport system substrate-binding protein